MRARILGLLGLTEADAAAAIGEDPAPCFNCGTRWHNRALPCGCRVCSICAGRGRAADHVHAVAG